jgi:putative inorganic carbon (hco3(-)) transporter
MSRADITRGVLVAPPGAPATWRARLDSIAFVLLLTFTAILFVNPERWAPGAFAAFPIQKALFLLVLLAYAPSVRNVPGWAEWPTGVKALLAILALGVLHLPFARDPGASMQVLSNGLKMICVLGVLAGVVRTESRLRVALALLTVTAGALAVGATHSYLSGQLTIKGLRIEGPPGLFENPNNLGAFFAIAFPLTAVLALESRGLARAGFAGLAVAILGGEVATATRGGFLGILAAALVLAWRLGRRRPAAVAGLLALSLALFLAASPPEYVERLGTILAPERDALGSAQERLVLLAHAVDVVAHHPVVGVGMGNYPLYSIDWVDAHNSPLQIAAELGLAGLVAYLTVIGATYTLLVRASRDVPAPGAGRLGAGLQAALAAYFVSGLFGSYQYSWVLHYLVGLSVGTAALTCEMRERAGPAHDPQVGRPYKEDDDSTCSPRPSAAEHGFRSRCRTAGLAGQVDRTSRRAAGRFLSQSRGG